MNNLTIVVPCFNAAAFIENFLSDYDGAYSFRFIFVDDASNDHTTTILQNTLLSYGLDDHAKILKLAKNSGAGAARNYGLKHCTTDYVCFLDIDDVPQWENLSIIFKDYADGTTDLIYSNYQILADTLNPAHPQDLDFIKKHKGTYLHENYQKELLYKTVAFPWNKIYRTELARQHKDLLFGEFKVQNDLGFVWKYSYLAKKVYVTDKVTYIYNNQNHNGRISTTKSKTRLQIFDVLIEVDKFLLKYNADDLTINCWRSFRLDLLKWVYRQLYENIRFKFFCKLQQYRNSVGGTPLHLEKSKYIIPDKKLLKWFKVRYKLIKKFI